MKRIRPTSSCVVAGALLVSLCGNAHALWGSDPDANFAIADRSGEQVLPKIVNDWSGGGYVGWFDSSAGAYQVYLQRLDGTGFEFWGHNGLLISDHPQSTSLVEWDLLLERDGDAIVAFTDTRAGNDLDVYLYRIGQNGAFVWGADGITVSANDDYEPSPALCQASDGDVVVVWPRLPDVGDGSLRMQRYAPDGTPRFAAGGIDIVTAPNESPAFCRVIPSDDGSVIVGYLRDIDSFSAPRHLRAVKVAANGTIAWGPLAVYDAVSLPIGYQPQMVADTAGGAIFCFHRSQSNNYNSVVQRVTSAGAEVFPHNGVLVSTLAARYHINPSLAYNAATNECFVFWNEETTNQSQWGIRMQKITPIGVRAWGDVGVPLVTMNGIFRSPPRAVPVTGGAEVFFSDQPTGMFNQERVLGYRVDALGGTVWGPVVVSSHLSSKARLPVVVDADDICRMVWEDDRNGTPDIYGQAIKSNGQLGGSTTDVPTGNEDWSVRLAPNPSRGQTLIRLAGMPGAIGPISIVDAGGRAVRTFGSTVDGTLRWDGRDGDGRLVPSGVYWLRVTGASGASARLAEPIVRLR